MERLRIVLASGCLAGYPEGGGHWSAFLQHLFGLDALGHDVFWLELRPRRAGEAEAAKLRKFGARMDALGFANRWALALFDEGSAPDLDQLEFLGAAATQVRAAVSDADLLWNFACTVRPPLLERFRRRALIDGDPGVIQISALDVDLALAEHDVLFTAGLNIGEADCLVPTVGRMWERFPQFVHLPRWPDPGPAPAGAKFTSLTQWGWGELYFEGRSFSVSKRDAYMRFVAVPQRCGLTFELAANMDPRDPTGDIARLRESGWTLVDPHEVAPDPAAYRNYIAASRGEFCCPKPIYAELRTGWFSDRSAAFLASGRPVAMQDTALAPHLPTGAGLVCFADEAGAVAAVQAIAADYESHARAARELAKEHLDATRVLARMLERCSAAAVQGSAA